MCFGVFFRDKMVRGCRSAEFFFIAMYHFGVLKRYYGKEQLLSPKEYNEAVELWADDVYRFALSCCRDSDRSHDAVQEAFSRLWEMRDQIECGKCKGFLIRVTQNKLRDAHRHDRIVAASQETLSREQETVTHPTSRIDLRDALDKAMAVLSEQQRTILTLHDLEGYSYDEIASMMKINYRQVQVGAFRARIKMREILTKLGFDENQ